MAKKMNMITGVAALALVFGAAPAFAQYGGSSGTTRQPQGRQEESSTSQDNSDTTSANTKSSGDENFAKKAAEGGMAEVKLGQLAETEGCQSRGKEFRTSDGARSFEG